MLEARAGSPTIGDAVVPQYQHAAPLRPGLLPRGSLTDTLGRLRDAIADSRRANKWLGGVGPLLELRASSALHKEPDRLSWALRVAAEVAAFMSISTEHMCVPRPHCCLGTEGHSWLLCPSASNQAAGSEMRLTGLNPWESLFCEGTEVTTVAKRDVCTLAPASRQAHGPCRVDCLLTPGPLLPRL